MLKGHQRPRRSARPLLSLLSFRMGRSTARVHALGRFHIGGVAYFVWALPPHAGGTDIDTTYSLQGADASYLLPLAVPRPSPRSWCTRLPRSSETETPHQANRPGSLLGDFPSRMCWSQGTIRTF